MEFSPKKNFLDVYDVIPNGTEIKELQKIIGGFLVKYKVRPTLSTPEKEHPPYPMLAVFLSLTVAT